MVNFDYVRARREKKSPQYTTRKRVKDNSKSTQNLHVSTLVAIVKKVSPLVNTSNKFNSNEFLRISFALTRRNIFLYNGRAACKAKRIDVITTSGL